MKVAIVHEWISARAGSELVFERLARLWPQADLFALSQDPSVRLELLGRRVRTSLLNAPARSPLGRAVVLPLMPAAMRTLRQQDYDLVVSSSHAFSRAFGRPGDVHLSYTHTPLRFAWHSDVDGRGNGPIFAPARAVLRTLDRRYARNTTSLACNSSYVADRTYRAYGLDSVVIPPPCRTDYFASVPKDDPTPRISTVVENGGYLLSIGRFVGYKRHDIALDVAGALGLPVVVAGRGPLEREIRVHAERTPGASVVVSPTDEEVRWLYRSAAATIFGALEDFGIVPVESLAAGTPVVALDDGGALDTVAPHVGVRAPSQAVDMMVAATEKLFADAPTPEACQEWAGRFSAEAFDQQILRWAAQYVS
ncbi:MAG: glycosyltransferase [Actinomycetota bacterium]